MVLSLLISWECEFCDGFRNVIRQSAGLQVKRAQFNELIKILCKEVPAQSQHLGRKNIKLGNFDKSDLILTESTSLGKAVYSHEDWAQQYVSVGGEFSYWIDNIEGNVSLDRCFSTALLVLNEEDKNTHPCLMETVTSADLHSWKIKRATTLAGSFAHGNF